MTLLWKITTLALRSPGLLLRFGLRHPITTLCLGSGTIATTGVIAGLTLYRFRAQVAAFFSQTAIASVLSHLRSALLRRFVRRSAVPYQTAFTDVVRILATFRMKPIKPDLYNPHFGTAAVRSSAAKCGGLVSRVLENHYASRTVEIQGDLNGPNNSSHVHDPCDLRVDHDTAASFEAGRIEKFTDVDYYLDMNQQLVSSFGPKIIFGLVPTQTSLNSPGIHYHLTDKDTVIWRSHSGYECEHPVWNYGADYITARKWFQTAVYKVTRLTFPGDRQLIVLLPVAFAPWWLWPISGALSRAFGGALTRFKYSFEGGTAVSSFDEHGEYKVSISQRWPSAGQTMSLDVFEKLADVARNTPGNLSRLTEAALSRHLTGDVPALVQAIPALLRSKHVVDLVHTGFAVKLKTEESSGAIVPGAVPSIQLVTPKPNSPLAETMTLEEAGRACDACPCTSCVKPEQRAPSDPVDAHLGPHEFDEPPRTSGTILFEPLFVNEAGQPCAQLADRSYNSATIALQERLVKPKAASEQRMDASMHMPTVIRAFADELAKRIGAPLEPLTDEEVLARVRPVKVKATAHGLLAPLVSGPFGQDDASTINAFLKNEATTERKPSRLVEPLAHPLGAKFYKYVYALQDALHELPCYAFGMTPAHLAQRIAEMSAVNPVVADSDFKKYDATINILGREIEKAVYKACFAKEHHADIGRLTSAGSGLTIKVANTTTGAKRPKAKSGHTRSTGEPATSAMNTVINVYCGWRVSKELFPKCDPFSGYVCGGDDGLFFAGGKDRNVAPSQLVEKFTTISRSLGLDPCCAAQVDPEFFGFLARVFTRGSINSTADVLRLARKAHISPETLSPTDARIRAKEKLQALLTCDAHTPLIGDLLRNRLATFQDITIPDKKNGGYVPGSMCAFKENGSWPNSYEPWMDKYVGTLVRAFDAAHLEVVVGSRAVTAKAAAAAQPAH